MPLTRHLPVTEQLWNHPVPIYIETNPAIAVGSVVLYYRTLSDADYANLPMGRAGAGYAAEIPCTMVQPGQWLYYVAVNDPTGNLLATEGSSSQPFTINMLQALSGNAPTRPGGGAVPSCGPNGEQPAQEECVPGMPCALGPTCERSCVLSEDCLPGETCRDGCCRSLAEIEEEEEEEEEEQEEEGPEGPSPGGTYGFWAHLSVGLGLGVPTGTAKESKWFTAPDGTHWYGPDDYQHLGANPGTDRQTSDIASGLALSGFAARLGIAYSIIPEISVELNYRFSAPWGDDFPWLVEARAAWWFLTGPTHMVSAYVGGGAGVVTIMVSRVVFNQELGDPPSRVEEPYYKLSGFGAVSLGATYRYCFNEMFGVGAELAMNVLFLSIGFNMDLLFDAVIMF